MIATWPGPDGAPVEAQIDRLSFNTVGVSVFLASGDTFPVMLSLEAVLRLHAQYTSGMLTTLSFSVCPLLPSRTLH